MIPEEYEKLLDCDLTYKDILKYLYQCIPENLQKESFTFYKTQNEIQLGRHLYHYYIRNHSLIFTEKRVKNGIVYDRIFTPQSKKVYEKKLKTRKGKILKNRAFLAAFGIVFVLGAKKVHSIFLDQMTYEDAKQIKEYEIEQGPTVKVEDITIVLSEDSFQSAPISFQVEINPTDILGFQKRNRLVEKYGEIISFYSARYGMDFNFVVDLLSQESYSEYDDVLMEKKENIGQLTSSICTEPIVVPVFQENEVTEYQGYFILPESYPLVGEISLDEIDPTYLNDNELDNLNRAKAKTNVSWNVYHKKDVFYHASKNIEIAIGYLSYLVNQKEDLILGAMSYHAGLSKTRGVSLEQVVNGEIEAMDSYYISNILRYEPLEHYQDGFTFQIQLQNGQEKNYQIQNPILESENDYEKENGHHL